MLGKQVIVLIFLFLSLAFSSFAQDQSKPTQVQPKSIRVVLLGTSAGPRVRLDRYQMSTLVEAGGETLLFDCGRGALLRLAQAGVPAGNVSRLFITHLHSDHIVDVPDLYLSPWMARSTRNAPLEVWGRRARAR